MRTDSTLPLALLDHEPHAVLLEHVARLENAVAHLHEVSGHRLVLFVFELDPEDPLNSSSGNPPSTRNTFSPMRS